MAIHEEKVISPWLTVLILAAAFIIAYPFWDLGLRELFREEGDYAAIANEIASFPPSTLAHGELMPYTYPLYPLLAKGLSMLGFTMEFSLRFLSVFSLAILTVVVGIACYSMRGIQAAAAGAGAMFTTILVAEKAVEGYPHMLTVLLIFSGWLLWFYFGQVRGSWNRAWIFAGIFAGLAFYNSGWTALIYFFVPMAFLHRPFTVWTKLNKPGFYTACATILFFIFLWLIPRWNSGLQTAPFGDGDILGYLWHVIYTPFDILLRFLPWTFFLYAPFCVALMVIDETPLFSKYLRMLSYVLLILLCLNPFSKGRDILFLAPLAATLIGLNYWIVARRHGKNLCRILSFFCIALFLAGVCAILFHTAPKEIILQVVGNTYDLSYQPSGIRFTPAFYEACLIPLLALAAYVMAVKRKQVWVILVLFFCGMMLFFWSIINPYRASEHFRTDLGQMFRKAIGESYSPAMTVYKDAAIGGLYAECHYLGTGIRSLNLNDTEDISAPELFHITTSSVQPADTTRTWTRILDVIYKNQNIYLWKGRLNDRKDELENSDFRNIRF